MDKIDFMTALIAKHGFGYVNPTTLIKITDVDTVLVCIFPNRVVIFGSGREVVDSITTSYPNKGFSETYQDVLAKF